MPHTLPHVCALLCVPALAGAQADASIRPERQATRIEMAEHDGRADRPLTIGALMFPTVPVGRRGELAVGSEKVAVYLPKLRRFPLENEGTGDSSMENKAAYLYVDEDGDGKLLADEAWFCNLPFRVRDTMFEVVAIGERGDSVEVRLSAAPLAGAVRGRKLPPFSFVTMAGTTVMQDTFRGKHLVIQIWSPT